MGKQTTFFFPTTNLEVGTKISYLLGGRTIGVEIGVARHAYRASASFKCSNKCSHKDCDQERA